MNAAETEKKKLKLDLSAESVYLALLGFLLPIVVHDGYFDITETKTLVFCALTAAYLLYSIVIRVRRRESILSLPLSAGQIAAVCFALISAFSTLASGLGWRSFLGTLCRWQGSGMMLLYVLLYLAFSAGRIPRKGFLAAAGAGLAVSCALAVLDHQGMTILPFSARLTAFDRGRYISTLGNLNFAGAYAALLLPMTLCGSITSTKPRETALYCAGALFGLWGGMAITSECVVLGVGAAVVCMPFLLRNKPRALLRWAMLLILLPPVMYVYAFLCTRSGRTLSEYTSLFLDPVVSIICMAAGGAAAFFIRRRPERFLPLYRIVLLILLAAGILFVVIINISKNYVNQDSPLNRLIFSDSWGTDRVKIWKYCWRLFTEYSLPEKLIGGGCGVLASVDIRHRLFPDAVLDAAHCEYLQYLLHWGLLGLAAYLVWLGDTVRRVLRSDSTTARILLSGGIGYGIQALVNIAQTPATALFFAYLAAQSLLSQERTEIDSVEYA